MKENKAVVKVFVFSLAAYAFTSSFSISLQQFFFAVALGLFLFGLRRYYSFRWHNYYIVFLLWAFWRLFHVFISPVPIEELIEFREMWLFLIFPLMAEGIVEYSYSKNQSLRIFSRTPVEILLVALLAGGALTGYYNLVKLFFHTGGFFETNFRAAGFGDQNSLTFSGAISFALSLGFALLWFNYREEQKIQKKKYFYILIFLFLGSFLAFLLAKARGGYVALILAICFMVFFYRPKWFLPSVLVLVVFVSLSLILFPSLPGYFGRALPRADHHENTMEQRRDLWVAGWAMFKQKPLLGWGDVGYYQNYPNFQVAGAKGVAQKGSHMHNDMLNILVLYGLPGLILYLLFFGLPVYHFLKYRKILEESFLYPYFFMSIFATVFLFFQGLSQCHFSDDEVVTLFWFNQGFFYGLLNLLKQKSPT